MGSANGVFSSKAKYSLLHFFNKDLQISSGREKRNFLIKFTAMTRKKGIKEGLLIQRQLNKFPAKVLKTWTNHKALKSCFHFD